jgi:hypothetical protein
LKRTLTGIAAVTLALGTFAAPMTAVAATKHYNTTKVAHEYATTLKDITVNKTESFTVTIKDSHNKAISGALVSFSSSNTGVVTVSSSQVVTNKSGQATVVLTGHKAGTAYVTVKVNGNTHTYKVTVTAPAAATVDISGLTDGQEVTSASQTVTVKSNYQQSVKLYLNGVRQSGNGPTFNLTLAEGKNTITAVATNGVDTVKKSIYVTYTSQLKVSSVSALNAAQIQVKFNQPVDPTTATDTHNYSLNGVSLYNTPATDATITLSADGTTATITAGTTGGFGSLLQTGKGYVLTINGVTNKDGSKTISNFNSPAFSFDGDKTPASVTSISAAAATSTTTVKVTFSEPVKGVGLYYINGQAASIASNANGVVTLTAPTALAAGSTNTLQIVNESDTSGNWTNTTQSFTVTADTVAPTVSSVQAISDNTIRVTFSKKIDSTTIIGAAGALQNIKLIRSSDATDETAKATIAATKGDTTGTQFDITYSDVGGTTFTNGSLALSVVFLSGIKDASGNALTPNSVPVTLTLNKVAPVIQSVKYYAPNSTYNGASVGATGALVVTFNEPVKVADVPTSKYMAITDGGVEEETTTGTLTASAGASSNVLVLKPAAAFTGTNTETITFLPGAFTDASNGANQSSGQTVNVDIKGGAQAADTTAPTVTIGTATPVLVNGVYQNNITYTVDNDVDVSTVLNLNNYRLNGAPLPSGSYVTITPGTPDTVTIHLGQGTIKTGGSYSLTVSGIADKAGNVASTAVKTVTLKSDIAPTLTGATFNSDGTLSLTFSKSVSGSTGHDSDFTIKVNGTALTAGTQFTVKDGTGSDSGKVVVTFSGVTINSGDQVTITVSGSDVKDTDGNYATGSVTVTK